MPYCRALNIFSYFIRLEYAALRGHNAAGILRVQAHLVNLGIIIRRLLGSYDYIEAEAAYARRIWRDS